MTLSHAAVASPAPSIPDDTKIPHEGFSGTRLRVYRWCWKKLEMEAAVRAHVWTISIIFPW